MLLIVKETGIHPTYLSNFVSFMKEIKSIVSGMFILGVVSL